MFPLSLSVSDSLSLTDSLSESETESDSEWLRVSLSMSRSQKCSVVGARTWKWCSLSIQFIALLQRKWIHVHTSHLAKHVDCKNYSHVHTLLTWQRCQHQSSESWPTNFQAQYRHLADIQVSWRLTPASFQRERTAIASRPPRSRRDLRV